MSRYKTLYHKYHELYKNATKFIHRIELELLRKDAKIKDLNGKIKKLEKKLEESLTKEEKGYNELSYPTQNLTQIEAALKIGDKYTMKQIIKYLELDTFELVKNMTKIITPETAAVVLAHRDWALRRNEALKKLLLKYCIEKRTDRKLWSQEDTEEFFKKTIWSKM